MGLKSYLKLGLIGLLVISLTACNTTSSTTPEHTPIYPRSSVIPFFPSNDNLWVALGQDLHMNHDSNRPAVQEQIQWYMAHTDYIERTANRASPYVYYILEQIKKRKMPAELALLPVIESGYNPFAHSGAGASGLWQLMPSTGLGFNLRVNWWYDGRRDFYTATPAALDYLQYLSTLFHGDWLLTIAAYNSGEGTVNAAIRYNRRHNLPTDFWHLKLPEQTQTYVPSLLAIATILSKPAQYHVNWPATKIGPAIAAVQVDNQIDLAKAAELAEISVDEIYYLNPGYTRWATDPYGEHTLILPANKVADFKENLAKLPATQWVSWDLYVVKASDTLERIAKKFHTTPKVIQQTNQLKTRMLEPGTTLRVPKTAIASDSSNPAVNNYAMKNRSTTPPEPQTYIVKTHDTLKSIARQYRVDIRNLMFWNQLKAKEKLTPGTTIIISPQTKRGKTIYLDGTAPVSTPVKHTKPTLPVAASNESAPPHPPLFMLPHAPDDNTNESLLRPNSYEVAPGDTVITIAHKFGIKSKQLKSYNNLESDLLHVGQILKIPPQ